VTFGVSSDGCGQLAHLGVLSQSREKRHRVNSVVLVLNLRVKDALDKLKLFFRDVNLICWTNFGEFFKTTLFFGLK